MIIRRARYGGLLFSHIAQSTNFTRDLCKVCVAFAKSTHHRKRYMVLGFLRYPAMDGSERRIDAVEPTLPAGSWLA
jgi:hypothetical protein